MEELPWVPGAATGIGSLPGADPLEAARTVVGELPDLPYLPELPGRGVGADLVGRTASALLVGLEVDLQPAGWRLVSRPGMDARRGRALLSSDLDAFEELAGGYVGPVKVQAGGPWTLATSMELPNGGPVLGDTGARRDLAESLAEGVGAHVTEVQRRLPSARLLVQLDEPSLPAVLAGDVPTASGFSRIAAVDEGLAREPLALVLAAVVDAGGWPLVHCCASGVPFRLLHEAGARAVGFDTARPVDDDVVGELVESGLALLLGCVPSTEPTVAQTAEDCRRPVVEWWRQVGLDAELLATRTAVTPSCGLAGAAPSWARRAIQLSVEVGRTLAEMG